MHLYIYVMESVSFYKPKGKGEGTTRFIRHSIHSISPLLPSPIFLRMLDCLALALRTVSKKKKKIYAYSCDNLHCKAILKERRGDKSAKSALPSHCVCNMIQYNKVKCIEIESTVFYSLGHSFNPAPVWILSVIRCLGSVVSTCFCEWYQYISTFWSKKSIKHIWKNSPKSPKIPDYTRRAQVLRDVK